MTKEEMELIDRGFKQGFFQGFGEAMKIAIKLIETTNENRILPSDKVFLNADLKLQAKHLLQKKVTCRFHMKL